MPLPQVDMRIAETKKDTYEFKRDIIIGAENVRTGKIVAEKMIRYDAEGLCGGGHSHRPPPSPYQVHGGEAAPEGHAH